jgi:hypothetical protein
MLHCRQYNLGPGMRWDKSNAEAMMAALIDLCPSGL